MEESTSGMIAKEERIKHKINLKLSVARLSLAKFLVQLLVLCLVIFISRLGGDKFTKLNEHCLQNLQKKLS